jgi:hypothetical protein
MARPVVDEAFQTVEEFLTPGHLKRLQEIHFQSRGFQALDDAEVKEKLKMTPEQLGKLADLRKEMAATTALVARDRRDDPQTAMNNAYRARQAAVARIPNLLDEDQNKVWRELSGEPFSVP